MDAVHGIGNFRDDPPPRRGGFSLQSPKGCGAETPCNIDPLYPLIKQGLIGECLLVSCRPTSHPPPPRGSALSGDTLEKGPAWGRMARGHGGGGSILEPGGRWVSSLWRSGGLLVGKWPLVWTLPPPRLGHDTIRSGYDPCCGKPGAREGEGKVRHGGQVKPGTGVEQRAGTATDLDGRGCFLRGRGVPSAGPKVAERLMWAEWQMREGAERAIDESLGGRGDEEETCGGEETPPFFVVGLLLWCFWNEKNVDKNPLKEKRGASPRPQHHRTHPQWDQ